MTEAKGPLHEHECMSGLSMAHQRTQPRQHTWVQARSKMALLWASQEATGLAPGLSLCRLLGSSRSVSRITSRPSSSAAARRLPLRSTCAGEAGDCRQGAALCLLLACMLKGGEGGLVRGRHSASRAIGDLHADGEQVPGSGIPQADQEGVCHARHQRRL